jgi:hypothetical protein
MNRTTLRTLIKEAIRKTLKEQENLTPIDPGPGQEPEETPGADTPTVPSGTITTDQAKQLIKDTKGKFFTVTFIKKTDGTTRVMNARLGVKAYLKGGELPYNPDEKGLIPVYDMQKRAYRTISVGTIKNLKIGNNEYIVQ